MRPGDRFEALDGLRGLAAVLVMLHHVGPDTLGTTLMPGGYLAVDLFFMLSGLVIARAYEERLAAGLSVRAFMAARLRRLYPTMAVGFTAGALLCLAKGIAPAEMALPFLAQALFIPAPPSADTPALYPLDSVQWSLLVELLANLCHALLLWRLGWRPLAALAALGFVAVVLAAFHFGSLDIGFRWSNVAGAFPRAAFAYTMGILIHRCARAGRLPRVRPAMPVMLGLFGTLTLIACLWRHGGAGWWIDPLAVLLVPPMLAAGLGARLSPWVAQWSRRGGALSYPLYALHLPVVAMVSLLGSRLHSTNRVGMMAAACALSLIAAWALEAWQARPRHGSPPTRAARRTA